MDKRYSTRPSCPLRGFAPKVLSRRGFVSPPTRPGGFLYLGTPQTPTGNLRFPAPSCGFGAKPLFGNSYSGYAPRDHSARCLVPMVASVAICEVLPAFVLYAWPGAGRMRKLPGGAVHKPAPHVAGFGFPLTCWGASPVLFSRPFRVMW